MLLFISSAVVIIAKLIVVGQQYRSLKFIWHKFDEDGSGILERPEIVRLLTLFHGSRISKAELDKLYGEMDLAGDGQVTTRLQRLRILVVSNVLRS